MQSPEGCQQQTSLLYCPKTSDVPGLQLRGAESCGPLTTGPPPHHGWGGGYHEGEVAQCGVQDQWRQRLKPRRQMVPLALHF